MNNIEKELFKILEEDMPKNLTLEQKKKIENIKKELLND